MTLSPALLRFIELLPEVAAERAERDIEAKDGVLLHVGDDGHTRPMTRSELLRQGNRAELDAVEESLFATTYAEELLQILDLLGGLPCLRRLPQRGRDRGGWYNRY